MPTQQKIVMTLLVRNEDDIIGDNIQFHHAMGVDSFIIMDNRSSDGTAEIVRSLAAEIEIVHLYQSDDDYNQSLWVTGMSRRAAVEHQADWVINSDADEFWIPAEGDLKQLLSTVPKHIGALSVERHNAVVICPNDAPIQGRSHPRKTRIFERQSCNILGDPLPSKVLFRAHEAVIVEQGNHLARNVPGEIDTARGRLKILHFPFRSLAQYEDKIRLGGAAYARNTSLHPSIGVTWRTHHAKLQEDSSALKKFWTDLSLTQEEVDIGMYSGSLQVDDRLCRFFSAAGASAPALAEARHRLLTQTAELVNRFITDKTRRIVEVKREDRWKDPRYYNLRFCVSGAESQLRRLYSLTADVDVARLQNKFQELRDCFSLFPGNHYVMEFLKDLLEIGNPEAVDRLRMDCDGKPVILHTSCCSRLHRAKQSLASFEGKPGDYHHIILVGQDHNHDDRSTPLSLDYNGQLLTVPVPDNYESLHRKLFYAYMILDLLAAPRMVVKIDDDLILQDGEVFADCLQSVETKRSDYAGRVVGQLGHQDQWHSWHIGKCSDPLLEERGYQYPLPRQYAAGGYGYILRPKGLSACSYMYLAMQAFFSMTSVGLEDVCVGHAAYAQGLDLLDLSIGKSHLALPGLATQQMMARENGWRNIFGPR